MNKIILSLDMSLNKTGWSVMTNDGVLLYYGNIQIVGNLSETERLIYITNVIKSLIEMYDITHIVIEDVYYLRNIKTYCSLAQLVGVVRLIGYKYVGENVFVLPTTFVRSVFGLKTKEEVFNFVKLKYNLSNLNFDDHNDICDSIILGMCFIGESTFYKTKRMLSVEKKLDKDIREYLIDLYWITEKPLKTIASKLKVSYGTLYSWMQNLKIPIRDKAFRTNMFPKELTYEQEQVLLGTVMGDGGLYRSNKDYGDYCLQIGHSIDVKPYLEYKAEIFNLFFSSMFDSFKVDSNTYTSVFRTVYLPIFSRYAKMFYKNNIKIVNPLVLNKLDALGVAIWFMDDGYYQSNKYSGVLGLCTHGFSEEENWTIQKWFSKRFEIDFRVTRCRNYYYLKTGKKDNIDKFMSIVSKHVNKIDVMKYKLK